MKKDFEGVTSATLIQAERRASNIDSEIPLLGFDMFEIPIPQLHFGYFFNSIDPTRTALTQEIYLVFHKA